MRITKSDLDYQVGNLNENAGFERNPKYSTIGAYTLDYAYGGVQLQQYVNPCGGVRTISIGGYGTKRELYNFMNGMLSNV